MLVFRSPGFAYLECALARKPYPANQYLFVFARGYGMAAGREICVINSSTPPSEDLGCSSDSKRPLLWFSTPTRAFRHHDLLATLSAAQPPVIKITGRTKEIRSSVGNPDLDLEAQDIVRVLPEVELLLDEDDLARVCYFCFNVENSEEGSQFAQISGQGYGSFYQCDDCSEMSVLRKFWIYTVKAWINSGLGKHLPVGVRDFLRI